MGWNLIRREGPKFTRDGMLTKVWADQKVSRNLLAGLVNSVTTITSTQTRHDARLEHIAARLEQMSGQLSRMSTQLAAMEEMFLGTGDQYAADTGGVVLRFPGGDDESAS